MEGMIGDIISSEFEVHRKTVSKVFGPGFQTMDGWKTFLHQNLRDSVANKLGSLDWGVESFQALYVACWIHQPVEKGTFMINLSNMGTQSKYAMATAYKNMKKRPSSHLGGTGRSASPGWAFLKGYKELLIQIEETKGTQHMMLKCEGHTTGPAGFIPHLQSYFHKKKYGKGKTASEALNKMAHQSPLVAARAAENYNKGYEELVNKVLGIKGRTATIRDVTCELFDKAGFDTAHPELFVTAGNDVLGEELHRFCTLSEAKMTPLGARWNNLVLTESMLKDLRLLGDTLKKDGEAITPRVFNEVRVTPVEIDQSLRMFYSYTE